MQASRSALLAIPHSTHAAGQGEVSSLHLPSSNKHGTPCGLGSAVTGLLYRLATLAFVSAAFVLPALVSAQEPGAQKLPQDVRREAEKMRKVLEENFRACNEENIKALMATISPTMPGIADFHNESKRMFAETDVYLSLDSFELIAYRPPFGVARVVQVTLPRDEKDREAGPELQQTYRSDTALLPQWERAVYTQQFKKEAGKWRLHGILETPTEHVSQSP